AMKRFEWEEVFCVGIIITVAALTFSGCSEDDPHKKGGGAASCQPNSKVEYVGEFTEAIDREKSKPGERIYTKPHSLRMHVNSVKMTIGSAHIPAQPLFDDSMESDASYQIFDFKENKAYSYGAEGTDPTFVANIHKTTNENGRDAYLYAFPADFLEESKKQLLSSNNNIEEVCSQQPSEIRISVDEARGIVEAKAVVTTHFKVKDTNVVGFSNGGPSSDVSVSSEAYIEPSSYDQWNFDDYLPSPSEE
ncbi:MAG: hypothetical protein AB1540_17025, partial [Bdellovibrionota bacterium]